MSTSFLSLLVSFYVDYPVPKPNITFLWFYEFHLILNITKYVDSK